jgi:hypothetical protein
MIFGTAYGIYIIPVTANCSYLLLMIGAGSTRNMYSDLAIKPRYYCCIILDIGIHILLCMLSERCK